MDFNEQSAFEMLNILHKGHTLEKCRILTYIRSNMDRFKATEALTDDQYGELCELIIILLTSDDQVLSSNAGITLNNILCTLETHSLHFFQAVLQLDRKNRLRIFQFLEDVQDSILLTVVNDIMVIPFFHDYAENKELSYVEQIEERIINYALNMLQRLYKLSTPASNWDVHQFDSLLMSKVITLAYMGHKRQRRSAIRLLQQAVETDLGSNIRNNFLDIWQRYKTMLQSVYCKRIALLVEVSDPDWASLWNISVQLLGTDLHHGANLINNLLSVEEKAFKSTDTIIRRQAFGSWKILIDNFALDLQELATARRIKLLCIPLNAKNSKTELITITKLEVWWHLIVKLYNDLSKFVNSVLVPFLNFAFGPFGDTLLLSHKLNTIASAGKRFVKTNVLAIDILLQLLTPTAKECQIIVPTLTERLLHGIPNSIFRQSYKSFIHSVGEASIIVNDLSNMDVERKQNIITALWANLIHHVKELDTDFQASAYNDIILILMEIDDHVSNKQNIQSLLVNIIVPNVSSNSTNYIFATSKFINFMLKLLTPETFLKTDKKHYEAIKQLLWQGIKSNTLLPDKPNTLESIKTIHDKIVSLKLEASNSFGISELWCALADVLSHYVTDSQFHQGNVEEHAFTIIESILNFPFSYIVLNDHTQIRKVVILWKQLYRQYNTGKSNEIAIKVFAMISDCLTKNCNNYRFALNILDAVMSTINYEYLLREDGSLNIIILMRDVCIIVLNENNEHEIEIALTTLSHLLTTVHRYNSQKIVSYLEVIMPVIDFMFTLSPTENITKEITNTWKSVVSIFRGLNGLLTAQLLAQYRDIIIRASYYTNSEIQSQTLLIFDYHDTLQEDTKMFLQELESEIKKSSTKSEFVFKKNEMFMRKNIKMTGALLNRKTASKSEISNHQNNLGVHATTLSSESNTEEYVMIRPDFKFDVHRLTEHQLESLTRKRDNIPAMYNELSQSVSQDTQHLQEWFDKKIEEIKKTDNEQLVKLGNSSEKTGIDHSNNKENKVHAKSVEVDVNNKLYSSEDRKPDGTNNLLDTTSGLIVAIHNDVTNSDSIKEESLTHNDSLNKNQVSLNLFKSQRFMKNKVAKLEIPTEKLNIDSDKEILSAKTSCNRQRNSSANRKSDTFSRILQHSSKGIVSESTRPCIQMFHRDQGKISTITSSNVKENSDKTNHRGIKRKSMSDTEFEFNPQRKRRITISSAVITNNTNNAKSTNADQQKMDKDLPNEMGLSQRTKNEISRLRINMAFDTLLTNRRRSKVKQDDKIEEHASKIHIVSGSTELCAKFDPEMKDSSKKYVGIVEKNLKTHNNQEVIRKKGRNLKSVALKVDSSPQIMEISVQPNSCITKKISEDSKFQQKIKMRDKVYFDANACTLTKYSEVNDNIFKYRQGKERNANNIIDAKIVSNTLHSNDGSMNFLKVDQQIQTKMSLSTVSPSTTNEQMSDESEDIIECSQSSTDALLRDKDDFDRQCFIKINKIEKVQVGSSKENKSTDESAPHFFNEPNTYNFNVNVTKNDCKTQDCNQILQGKEIMHSDLEKNIDQGEVKPGSIEFESVQDPSIMLMCNSSVNYVSPKKNCSRHSKKKTYAFRGRAAHMLGLVTKHALAVSNRESVRMDKDGEVNKKLSKDFDVDTLNIKKDKLFIYKEAEKNGSPISSGRQEKIFNNMKSSDYYPSTSVNLLKNLNNDGDISSRMEKVIFNGLTTKTNNVLNTKFNETDALQLSKEELPMLEWSSANPPSLVASPSASILKRHQQFIHDVDTELAVLNKKKRVSFADPPVSMEMGYERTLPDSACRMNKLSILRNLNMEKESPLKSKQNKMENDQVVQQKRKTDSEIPIEFSSARDFQSPSSNKFLTKIVNNSTHSYSVATNTKVKSACALYKSDKNNVSVTRFPVNTLGSEVKISLEPKGPESESITETLIMERISLDMNVHTKNKKLEIEVVGTQQDLFDSIDTSNECNELIEVKIDKEIKELINISPQSSALDSVNLNRYSTNELDTFSKEFKSELLEDTIDAENLTELNLTEISDDIYCSKLIRTSTCAGESIGEQDTLPVMDSVFANLPLSQNTQPGTQNEIQLIQPEFLDSIQPICPILVVCQEPISAVVENLTNPLWLPYLSSYFTDRGICTVGDLARLTEREVNRMPVKGSPKVQFVRNVLHRFQNSNTASSQTLTNLSITNLHLITPQSLAQSVTASKCLALPTEPHYVKILPKITVASIVSDLVKIPDKTSHEHVKTQDYYQVIQYVNLNIAAKATFPEILTSHVSLCSQNMPISTQQWIESRNTTLQSLSMREKMSQTFKTIQITSDDDTSVSSVQSFLCTPATKHYVKTASTISITRSMCSVSGITRSTQTSSCNYMKITSTMPTEFIHSIRMSSNTWTSANLSQCIPTITTQMSGITSTVDCALSHFPCSTLLSASCSDLPGKSQKLISNQVPLITSIYSSTNPLFTGCSTPKATKCVTTQISLVDLLDKIDVNLIVESMIRRCAPRNILDAYKIKMKHLHKHELVTETIKMLGIESNYIETILETVCHLSGVNKLLMRLPLIFNTDKQFFVQVLNAYRNKLHVSEYIRALDFDEMKDTTCRKCSCLQASETLSNTVKTDEIQEITELVTDVSNLNTMVKQIQKNSSDVITKVLKSESSVVSQDIFDKLWDIDSIVSRITKNDMSRDNLLKIYNAVSTKLNTRDLLDAFHDTMRSKLKSEERTEDQI
ncbi:telomere-associated protein RIF1 isoform X2 [Cephus cinctus]|uniref:Telomere-associated protein RIF1 isoform X2 n=1 Tax=Cephus cinctus TaxID=211228 RepID=A0AAJ7BZ85_CEPCN|nr:telomere-associated protein RIF1 isoform X2 [Cephus cinctus]